MIFGNTLHPMVVLDHQGDYLYVQYKMKSVSNRYGRIKIHRKLVFVIERLNVTDGLWDLLLKPADAILATEAGEKAKELAMPTIDYAVNLVMPVYYSSGLVAKGVKTSVKASLKGAEWGIKGAVNQGIEGIKKTRKSRGESASG